MPGFIDAHRHIVTGNAADWLTQRAPQQMQEFLDAGFTTVLAAIDPPQAIEARKRIEAGKMKGPRLYVGTFMPVAGPHGPPPNGDPARTDPARGPFRHDARARNPARRDDQGCRERRAGGLRLSEGRAQHDSEWT